jgi:hypothetical protein
MGTSFETGSLGGREEGASGLKIIPLAGRSNTQLSVVTKPELKRLREFLRLAISADSRRNRVAGRHEEPTVGSTSSRVRRR